MSESEPIMTSANHPRWLVLLNPKSGLRSPGMPLLRAMEEAMDGRAELLFQISRSVDDGQAKARAVYDGIVFNSGNMGLSLFRSSLPSMKIIFISA